MKPFYGYIKTHGGFYLAEENPQIDFFSFVFKIFSLSIFIFTVIEFC